MAETNGFCPVCASPIAGSAANCARCSAAIDAWDFQSFVDKLIGALRHPLADIRMRAIIVLGRRRERAAEGPLAKCALDHPSDVVQGLAVVQSLHSICANGQASQALERLAAEHPARAVRAAAREAIEGLRRGRV